MTMVQAISRTDLPTFRTADDVRNEYPDLVCCYILGFRHGDRHFGDAGGSKLIRILQSPTSFQTQLIRLLTPNSINDAINELSASSNLSPC